MVQIDRGVPAKRVDIVYRDLTKPGSYFEILIWGVDSRFSADYVKGAWYVSTDYKSPNWRIMKADPGIMPDAWTTIVPEGPDAIDSFNIVGGKIYVDHLHDAKMETDVYTLDGKPAGNVEHEGIGMATTLAGHAERPLRLLQLRVVHCAAHDLPAGHAHGQAGDVCAAQGPVRFKPIRTEAGVLHVERWYPGADVCRREEGIEAGRHRTFADDRLRRVQHKHASRVETYCTHGGCRQEAGSRCLICAAEANTASAGTKQGMFEKKQNVFDDFYAAAEYLIANKYTSPEHFAIYGGSNGGLLMGAAITQRPELFSAVDCAYPLLDMLRYQKFEQGPHWMTEYGSAGKDDQFTYLLKYSPYQNVKKGIAFPAVLFFTGASDTRVDPLHARKMTALLQADSSSGRPVLLHYSVSGGHSAGVGVGQKIQDATDQLTFLWTETGQPSKQK